MDVTMQAAPMASGIDQHRLEHRLAGEEDGRQHHGGDHRHRIGLEQVGRHAGAIADVVADVVGDGGRVARIVFRDAGLDLADEIAADVGALGEDAAAETGEDRDQRGAEAERHERVDDRAAGRREAGEARQDEEVDGDAEKGEAGDQHARDGAGLEGDVEAAAERHGRRLRGADIGAHRHVHADEAGRARQHGADQEPDRDPQAEEIGEEHEQDDPDRADRHVLAAKIGLRAFGDRSGDFLHALRAGIALHDVVDGPQAVSDRQRAAQDDQKECGHYSSLLGDLARRNGKRAGALLAVAQPERCRPTAKLSLGAQRAGPLWAAMRAPFSCGTVSSRMPPKSG